MNNFVDNAARSATFSGGLTFGGVQSQAPASMIDQAARILASPMPRRQALRLAGGALLGGILLALTGCKVCTGVCTGSLYCATTKTCCTTGYSYLCGGECYSNGCPANLVQQSRCYKC